MLTDSEAWRKRLNRFKVVELRTLAAECSLIQSGKKAELIGRLAETAPHKLLLDAIYNMNAQRSNLVSSSSPNSLSNPVDGSGNIANVATRSRPTKRADRRAGPHALTGSYPDENNSSARVNKRRKVERSGAGSREGGSVSAEKLETCLCRGTPSRLRGHQGGASAASTVIRCPKCLKSYHASCLCVNVQEIPSNFLCPRCRFADIDPFYPTLNILHLTTLWDDPTSSAHVAAKRSLPLKSPNINELRRAGSEVFLFCLRLNNWTYNKLHEWPLTVSVKVNSNTEKVNKPEYEHKRRDVPMKITPYLMGDVQNQIEVTALNFDAASQNGSGPSQYVIALCLCGHKSTEDLQREVLLSCWLPLQAASEHALSTIGRFFGKKNNHKVSDSSMDEEDDDIDILDTSCRIKLICPITLTRMRIPARGRNCEHLQCFDLRSFLEVTKSTKAFGNRWKCVECNRFIRPNELLVDTYIQSILSTADQNAEAVVFQADGTWKEQISAICHNNSDESDVEEEAVIASDTNIELVDLSSSDEDDEAPLKLSEVASKPQTQTRTPTPMSAKASCEPTANDSKQAGAAGGMTQLVTRESKHSHSARHQQGKQQTSSQAVDRGCSQNGGHSVMVVPQNSRRVVSSSSSSSSSSYSKTRKSPAAENGAFRPAPPHVVTLRKTSLESLEDDEDDDLIEVKGSNEFAVPLKGSLPPPPPMVPEASPAAFTRIYNPISTNHSPKTLPTWFDSQPARQLQPLPPARRPPPPAGGGLPVVSLASPASMTPSASTPPPTSMTFPTSMLPPLAMPPSSASMGPTVSIASSASMSMGGVSCNRRRSSTTSTSSSTLEQQAPLGIVGSSSSSYGGEWGSTTTTPQSTWGNSAVWATHRPVAYPPSVPPQRMVSLEFNKQSVMPKRTNTPSVLPPPTNITWRPPNTWSAPWQNR